MPLPAAPADLPAGFAQAVRQLRAAKVRPEVVLAESPAPVRLAPHAVAVEADVVVNDAELATGRLVVLHDPSGQDAWEGTTRCVAYVRAPVERDLAEDPALPAVGWSWLLDALDAAGAPYRAAAGTVSRITAERFGSLSAEPNGAELEVRASWSPAEDDLGPHVVAFAELLAAAAGLPPPAPGVVAIPPARARRGATRPRRVR